MHNRFELSHSDKITIVSVLGIEQSNNYAPNESISWISTKIKLTVRIGACNSNDCAQGNESNERFHFDKLSVSTTLFCLIKLSFGTSLFIGRRKTLPCIIVSCATVYFERAQPDNRCLGFTISVFYHNVTIHSFELLIYYSIHVHWSK